MPSFTEKSIQRISEFDSCELEIHQQGEHIGSGSSAITYTFCNIEGLDLALKVPRESERGDQAKRRVASELATGSFLLEHVPQLEPLLPTFIGILGVKLEGAVEPIAILTEDASQGNTIKVRPKPASIQTIEALAKGFEQFGALEDIFDDEVLRNTVSFDVDGQERFLDFTPPPFSLRHYLRLPGYSEAYVDAWERAEDWTIEISPDSPLAQSLPKPMPEN